MLLPGLLIVISGPSGTGKGTVCKALTETWPHLRKSVSATTRPPRAGELAGVDYFFKDIAAFEEMINNNEFLEWARVYDNYYGTPRRPVLDCLARGEDLILEIDTQGALQIKHKFPAGIFIFLLPPTLETLRSRITGRGLDAPEVIEKRLNCAVKEMELLHKYDYVLVNDHLDPAVETVKSIITAEKYRTGRYDLTVRSGKSFAITPKIIEIN